MRSLCRTSMVFCALMGFLMVGPRAWSQSEVELPAEPQLGKSITVPREAEGLLCEIKPSLLGTCIKATSNGIRYTVAYRERGRRGNVVTHVYTDDPNFKSPDGLRVGGVLIVENPKHIIVSPGFEIYGRKGRGWIPVVGFNDEVILVREGQPNEKRSVQTLSPTKENPIFLRIIRFRLR